MGIAPSSIATNAETKDTAAKRRRNHWDVFIFNWQNDDRAHPYQRRRASITGLKLWIGEIIETERLVGVVTVRLFLLPVSVPRTTAYWLQTAL